MTPTPVVGVTTQRRLIPYFTTDMFKFRRRGVQIDNLVPGGLPEEQDQALASYIDSASSFMDSMCQQVLAATIDTQTGKAWVQRTGFMEIHPRYRPVIAVTDFWAGTRPDNMVQFTDLSGIEPNENSFSVPVVQFPLTSSAGPLEFGRAAPQEDGVRVRYSYVNGFPVATLTAPTALGATSIPVSDCTGIFQGLTYLTIYDEAGGRKETVLAGAVSALSGPGTVGCSPLQYAHPIVGTGVSDLPPDAIEAGCLLVRALVKQKATGSESTAAPAGSGPQQSKGTSKDPFAGGDDFALAEKMLRPYVAPLE